MIRAQVEALRRDLEQMAAAGASRKEFREWADAYRRRFRSRHDRNAAVNC